MKRQSQPTRWSCLPTAFAMLLDLDASDFIRELDHNGSAILWPEFPEPFCRQGFHLQEIIDLLLEKGYLTTIIEKELYSLTPENTVVEYPTPTNRFNRYLESFSGVLISQEHAVAYSHGRIYDPNGNTIYLPSDGLFHPDYLVILCNCHTGKFVS